MNVLVCTLGASWTVVPAVCAFLAPRRFPAFDLHPDRDAHAALRERHALAEPDEVWIVTSAGERTERTVMSLLAWWEASGSPGVLRVWQADGTSELDDPEQCEALRELAMRAVLAASEATGPAGRLMLSIAGGRKTMSADLQAAGSVFGASALLHVVGPTPVPTEIGAGAKPIDFARPLPPELAATMRPVLIGRSERSEFLDIALDGVTVSASRFPLPRAEPVLRWRLASGEPRLSEEIERRRAESARLLGNFVAGLARREPRDTWRSLYRLAPAAIDVLRTSRIGHGDRDWLARLPKADLHRHLGGCLDLAAQRRVAAAIWADLSAASRDDALVDVRPLLHASGPWPWEWPAGLTGDRRAARSAALLVHADPEALETNLFRATEPRLALRSSPRGFVAYERPGELTGSAVLVHPAALQPYADALVAQSVAEGLAYVELRGSPQKYRPHDPAGFVRDLRTALSRACRERHATAVFSFVWILDRRRPDDMPAAIGAAVNGLADLDGFLVGLDLAGDEGTRSPERLAPHFVPAFRACLKITIHAGEGEPAQNIWEAAYHLHADRVGHGLSLLDDAALRDRFRDRGVCIELCPTSNREVVGFADPSIPASAGMPRYPFRGMLDAGLPVVICTDNPGISRTTLADEYVAASRMEEGGLSCWTALAVMHDSFARAFAAASIRESLLASAESVVFDLASEHAARKLADPASRAASCQTHPIGPSR